MKRKPLPLVLLSDSAFRIPHSAFVFARPWLLALAALVPLLGLLAFLAERRRRRALQRVGEPIAVAGLAVLRGRARRRARLCLTLALLLLAVAAAGPSWGKGGEAGVAIGRDLMVVLDLSKSMLADDMDDRASPTRFQAAREGIRELANAVQRSGGHRLGLVVFAGRPRLVCALTTDYDHFRMMLDEFDPNAPPPEVYPPVKQELPSNTRFGAALRWAVAAHDPRFIGYQDVLLVSDGDDPAGDNEWQQGVRAAREAQIPVHTVGVGGPEPVSFTIGDEVIKTRLEDRPLKEIARLTGGLYLPAGRTRPALAEFFRTQIEPRPSRELSDDALPQPRDRAVWFLIPALGFLLLGWWLEERR